MGMRNQNLKFKLIQISHAQVKDARAAQAAASATVAKLERQYIEERNLRREVDLPPTKPITCTFFICLAHHLKDISSCSCHQSHLPVPCTLHELSVEKILQLNKRMTWSGMCSRIIIWSCSIN